MIGLDLGTAHARAAVPDEDGAQLVPDSQGNTAVPAALGLEHGNVRLGTAAWRLAIEQRDAVVCNPKTLLGGPPVPLAGRALAPEQIVGTIIGHMATAASICLGHWPQSAVLCSPAWFDSRRQRALAQAAVVAGLAVPRIVLEQTAILAYLLRRTGSRQAAGPQRIAVVDVGAGGSSVAVFELCGSRATLLSCAGDQRAGGNAVDQALISLVLREVPRLRQHAEQVEADSRLRLGLQRLLARLRRELSRTDSVVAPLDWLPGERQSGERLMLDRGQLDGVLGEALGRLDTCCRKALSSAGLGSAEDLDELLLTGGMSHEPAVGERIKRLFRRSLTPLHEPGAVALGAVLLAARSSDGTPVLEVDESRRFEIPAGPRPVTADRPPASPPASSRRRRPPPSSRRAGPRSAAVSQRGAVALGKVLTDPRPICNPTDPRAIVRLPLGRKPTAEEIDPIALPVLLMWVLRRADTTGTITIEHGEQQAQLMVLGGRGHAHQAERRALCAAAAWPEASYHFDATPPKPGDRPTVSMPRLIAEGLRTRCRLFTVEEMSEALADHLDLAPMPLSSATRRIGSLGLDPREKRLIEAMKRSGHAAREVIAHGGTGALTTLPLLIVLTAFECLSWQAPTVHRAATLVEDLQVRAEKMDRADHFDALGVHWSAGTQEVERAAAALREAARPGGEWAQAAPAACERMRERVDAAYQVLVDPSSRGAYRMQQYPDADYEALDDLLQKRIGALQMKQQLDAKSHTEGVRRELLRSQRKKKN